MAKIMANENNNYSNVVLPLNEYNELRDANRECNEENEYLNDVIRKFEKDPKTKVIVKTIDPDTEEVTFIDVVGFDDIKKSVEEHYHKMIDALCKELVDVAEHNTKLNNDILDLEMQVSRLKHRNLWQRIINK